MTDHTQLRKLAKELMQAHEGHSDEGPSTFSDAAKAILELLDEIERLKSQRFQFASALVDAMCGTQDHDIQADTGLPQEDCDRIAKARADAQVLLVK